VANAELRRAVAVATLLALPACALASPSSALKRYQSGRFDAALREYERLLRDKPDDPELHFNAGAAAYRVQDYEEAAKHLQSSLTTPDLQLQQRAYYNLGNAQFRRGEEADELDRKQQSWDQAVASYESAVKLDPKDADARFNLDVVKQKLEELKKQQQQQQSKGDQQDKKEQQNQQDQQSQQEQPQGKDDPKQQEQENAENKPQPQPQDKQQEQQRQKEGSAQNDKKEAEAQQGHKPQEEGNKTEQDPAQAAKVVPLRMTPQEAQQLLDMQKNEEKTMIFLPQMKTNRLDRVFKDW
jgi:Ca-activated chloride channel family protein